MTALEFHTISGYFQWAGSVIILISCLPYFTRRLLYMKVLGLYAVNSIFFSLLQQISTWFFGNIGQNLMANIYTLLEAWVLSLLFYTATKNIHYRRGVFVMAVLYTIFYVIAFLFFVEHSFSFIRFGRDFLMIIYSLVYFYYLIRELPEEDLLKTPMFWINAAVIFFFSGTLILSIMRDYIVFVLKNDMAAFWAFRNFFRFSFCLVLAYAAWLDWRLIKSKEASVNP